MLLDGEPLGAILRVPRQDEIRSNIHVGGSVVPTELTAREQELVRSIAPRLGERVFALCPLLDVAPDARDPRTGDLYATFVAATLPINRAC